VIPAEVRGKLRTFNSRASERRAALDAAMSTQTFSVLVALYCSRTEERGRRRALERLRKVLDRSAQFEIARLHRPALALWSSIVPGETGAHVELVMIGRAAIAKRRWNLVVSEHALIRFFERSGGAADLDAALIKGNRECARGRFHRLRGGTETIVKAGPGVFCGIVEPDDAGAGAMTARTWLHADQLREDQERRLAAAAA
jgi:hypothetical protein